MKTGGLLDWFRGEAKPLPPGERRPILEKASARVSLGLQGLLMGAAPAIHTKIQATAKSYGIDPLYLAFLLVRPMGNWAPMAPPMRDALHLLRQIITEEGNLPQFGRMTMPAVELEDAVDQAMEDLAAWARVKFLPNLRKAYYKLVEKEAKPYQSQLRREGQDLPALEDAASQVSGFMRYRLDRGLEMSPLALLMSMVFREFARTP